MLESRNYASFQHFVSSVALRLFSNQVILLHFQFLAREYAQSIDEDESLRAIGPKLLLG